MPASANGTKSLASNNATRQQASKVSSGAASSQRTDRAPAPSAPSRTAAAVSNGGAGAGRTDRAPVGLGGALSAAHNPAPGGGIYGNNKSYGGPIGGGNSLTHDARFAVADQANFHPAPVTRTPGDAAAMAKMANAESLGIQNNFGMPNTGALQGTMDVMRNRMLSNKTFGKSLPGVTPNSVQDVISQQAQFSPYADGLYARTKVSPTDVKLAEGVLSGETPSVVGNSLNYANTDYLKTPKGIAESSAKTRAAFAGMDKVATFSDVKRPGVMHSFGTIGTSDVAFNDTGQLSPDVQVASNAPSYKVAPAKTPSVSEALTDFTNIVKSVPKAKTTVAGRPDVPVGSFPAAGLNSPAKVQTTVAGRPDVPVGSLPAAKVQTTVAGRPDVPVGSLPAAAKADPMEYLRNKAKTRAAQAAAARATTIAGRPDVPVGALPAAKVEDLTKAEYDRVVGKTTIAGRPDVPVGSMPGAVEDLTRAEYDRVVGKTTIAGRPDVPVGSLPAARFRTTIAGRPDVPVGSFPAAKLNAPPDWRNDPAQYSGIEGVPKAPAVAPTKLRAPGEMPTLAPYQQSPEDLARQQSQIDALKKKIAAPGYKVNPGLAATLAPVNKAMDYYKKNKFAINMANSLGALEKPVNKALGAGVSSVQDWVNQRLAPQPHDVSPAKPGNLIASGPQDAIDASPAQVKKQVAENVITAPQKVIDASPALQKLNTTSPGFLERLFADAKKSKSSNNKFTQYIADIATPEVASSPFADNAAITKMFAALAAGKATT